MKNKLAIFLAAVFFAVQMLSFQHMAENGFKQHEHKGHVCEIAFYTQQSQDHAGSAKAPELVHNITYITAKQVFESRTPKLSFLAIKPFSHAPPQNFPA